MKVVGITGGIGSGKSTVSRIFASLGVPVYDSDSAAKRLMNESKALKSAILSRFGDAAYVDGVLNRAYLADVVFKDGEALAALNALVHPAVREDFRRWTSEQSGDYVVLECAILFESGMDELTDCTVAVLAPVELRIERTCRRDKSDREAVKRRIEAQTDDDTLCRRADFTIVNIFETDLEPAVKELDYRFRHGE